jgi:hypothetical protein
MQWVGVHFWVNPRDVDICSHFRRVMKILLVWTIVPYRARILDDQSCHSWLQNCVHLFWLYQDYMVCVTGHISLHVNALQPKNMLKKWHFFVLMFVLLELRMSVKWQVEIPTCEVLYSKYYMMCCTIITPHAHQHIHMNEYESKSIN